MSDAMAKEERSKAKDARQGRGNKKSRSQKLSKKTKKKPFLIYSRSKDLRANWREWHVRSRYATEKQRDEALNTLRKKATYQEYKKGE